MSERAGETDRTQTPAGGHAQPIVTPCAVGQAQREVAAVSPAGHDCSEAQAWRENYYGMSARWAECDTERLALKDRLADAEMRLRLLATPTGEQP